MRGVLCTVAAIVVVVTWLIAMSLYYGHMDGLTFEEGMYFAFVTATTIGLGDFAPTRSRDHFLSYVFVGLSVTIMSVGNGKPR